MVAKLKPKDGQEDFFTIDRSSLLQENQPISLQKEEFYLHDNNCIYYNGNKQPLPNTIFLEIPSKDVFEFNKKKIVDEKIYPDGHVWVMKFEDEKNWNQNFKSTIFPKQKFIQK